MVDRPEGSHRILGYLRAGKFLGEMALLGAGVRSANLLTAGKCELVKLSRAAFKELCHCYPEVEKTRARRDRAAPSAGRAEHPGTFRPPGEERPIGLRAGRGTAGDGPALVRQVRQRRKSLRISAR